MNIGDRPRGWAENPRFSLDMMSAGQRYTVGLTVALLTLGTPDDRRQPAAGGLGPTPGAVSAGLVQPPSTAAAVPSAPDIPLPTSPDTSPAFVGTPTAAPSEATTTTTSSTTTTTTFVPSPLPSLPVPLP